MTTGIFVPLKSEEQKTIQIMASERGLTPPELMKMAFRTFQIVSYLRKVESTHEQGYGEQQ